MDTTQSRIRHLNSNPSHKTTARSKDCSTQTKLFWYEIKTQADLKKREETLKAKIEELETQLTQENPTKFNSNAEDKNRETERN